MKEMKMEEIQEKSKKCVESARRSFNDKESFLIENCLSERCICAKFAQYLDWQIQKEFKGEEYSVDVEYNRGDNNKEYMAKRSSEGRLMVVDLIVHKRNSCDDNLVCIEMKKAPRGSAKLESDKNRLRVMTSQNGDFKYKIGFMIIIDLKDAQNEGMKVESMYVNGNILE